MTHLSCKWNQTLFAGPIKPSGSPLLDLHMQQYHLLKEELMFDFLIKNNVLLFNPKLRPHSSFLSIKTALWAL